ncbi:MAG: hypothetical protein ACLUHE_08490 [Christensenellales bacterium]
MSIILSLMDARTAKRKSALWLRDAGDGGTADDDYRRGECIPSLAELLAQFDACKAAAGAANTAAGKAISAASAADVAAKAAQYAGECGTECCVVGRKGSDKCAKCR